MLDVACRVFDACVLLFRVGDETISPYQLDSYFRRGGSMAIILDLHV